MNTTTTLTDLMEKAVTLPLTVEMERISEILWKPTIYQRNARQDRQWVADLPSWPSETPPLLATLIVHCVNNFRPLVEALEEALSMYEVQLQIEAETDPTCVKMRAALTAAQTIPSGEDRTHLLRPFRVTLKEDKGDKFTIVFDCQAEDVDHADEQAMNAYPDGEIVNTIPFPSGEKEAT